MPTYSFKNKDTGEIHDEFMRISAKEQFLLDNHQLVSTITGAHAFVGDHITIKKDTGFKEVLQRIHSLTPGSQLDKTSSQI
jgi:hypothetical protein